MTGALEQALRKMEVSVPLQSPIMGFTAQCGPVSVTYEARTDRGLVRDDNDDALIVSAATGLFGVCDGMGGHAAGEIASSVASTSLTNHLKRPCKYPAGKLLSEIQLASEQILADQETHPEHHGMGTTATVLWLAPDGSSRVWIGHVGDSRVYRLRDSKLEQLTEDHSWTFLLYKEGCLTKEQARAHPGRNLVSRALGHNPNVETDILSFEPAEGDKILLCTDGLSDLLSDKDICSILSEHPCDEAADLLVAQATASGGSDNISLVLLEVTGVRASN